MKRTQYCLTVCVTYQTMPTLNFLWNDKSHFLGLIAYVTSQKENRQLQLLGPSPNILLKHLCLNSSPRIIVHIYFLKCEDKQQGGLSCRRNELSYKSRWRKITVRNRAKFSDISSTGADGSAKPISSCPVKLYDLSSSATCHLTVEIKCYKIISKPAPLLFLQCTWINWSSKWLISYSVHHKVGTEWCYASTTQQSCTIETS